MDQKRHDELTSTLLPCPFCGEEAGIGTQYPNPPGYPVQHDFVNCTYCGALMDPAHFNPDNPPSTEEVVTLWNTRKMPSKMIDLTEEALNCLKFWQGHEMYGGSFSDVIVQQMEEWINRDRSLATDVENMKELESIKRGEFS